MCLRALSEKDDVAMCRSSVGKMLHVLTVDSVYRGEVKSSLAYIRGLSTLGVKTLVGPLLVALFENIDFSFSNTETRGDMGWGDGQLVGDGVEAGRKGGNGGDIEKRGGVDVEDVEKIVSLMIDNLESVDVNPSSLVSVTTMTRVLEVALKTSNIDLVRRIENLIGTKGSVE